VTEHNLIELGDGVFSLCAPVPRFGLSNIGVVVEPDGVVLIDCGATPRQGHAVWRMLQHITGSAEPTVKQVIVSSSRAAFTGGSSVFRSSAFLGTTPTSDELDTPADPGMFRRLLPHLANDYPDDFTTRPITHTVDETTWISDKVLLTALSGEATGNLVASVPSAGVHFLGALGTFGVTPLMFDGDPHQWMASLDALTGDTYLLIPGHGPPGGAADASDLAHYLQACIDAEGNIDKLAEGPWQLWSDRRFDEVNIERAHLLSLDDHALPSKMFELLGFA